MKLLVFDIGSNTIRTARLTDDAGDEPQIFSRRVYTTRLAEGLAETGSLSQSRMMQSLLVIRSVHAELAPQGFSSYAYATSAVRDAVNGRAFLASVEEIIGKGHARILTGQEEATFAQRGADPSGKRTLVDIGGGSTQIVRASARESWPIGCVRAKDLAPYETLSEIGDALYPILSGLFGAPGGSAREISASLPETQGFTGDPLGVGGTITTLALLSEGTKTFSLWDGEKRIDILSLRNTLHSLDAMGAAERARIPLLKDRHDVILHGGVILQFLLERLGCTKIFATLSDGLNGYALHLFRTLLK